MFLVLSGKEGGSGPKLISDNFGKSSASMSEGKQVISEERKQ